jgi:hypothetical protein
VKDLRFRIYGFGVSVFGLQFRDVGLGCMVHNLGSKVTVQGLGFRV